MREIIFRGKTESGKWVYGGFFKTDNESYIIKNTDGVATFNLWDFAEYVIPETVGQYTGLTETAKKGKKIFEGDIVKIIYNDRLTRRLESEDYESYLNEYELIEQVVFYKGAFCSMVKVDDIPLYRPLGFDIYEKSMLKAIEVIGNIHDNPELL